MNRTFWNIRSDHYDKLFWTRDRKYLELIKRVAKLDKRHLLLDVGTGTGTVAKYLQSSVKHVIGLDISSDMLAKGIWSDISVVKWDIGENLFADNIFDKIVVRMVLHHVTSRPHKVFERCHAMLRPGGHLIVAEGTPPSDESEVIAWYKKMFVLKEKRLTFSESELLGYFEKSGFGNIKKYIYMNARFSISNWLENSGLNKDKQKKIFEMHVAAPRAVKLAYNMKNKNGDCIITTKNVIIVGAK